ncbi:MAG: hypothetical protein H3C62_05055 [Gemmatimonadaceae bacterium]|nr:hypothetical protein [Gemmatimonadaceae bacterium]
MPEQLSLILDSLRNAFLLVGALLPRLLLAGALMLLGWLLARGVQRLIVRLLRLAQVETLSERTGIDDFLVRGGVRYTIVTLTGQLAYWLLLLTFTLAAFNVVGLSLGPALVDRLADYVPSVVAALAVFVFGSMAARFFRGIVTAYLGNVGLRGAGNVGVLMQGALLAFVALQALEVLGIDTNLLKSIFQMAFGALCLGLAIAFGLGGRAWAEAVLTKARNGK